MACSSSSTAASLSTLSQVRLHRIWYDYTAYKSFSKLASSCWILNCIVDIASRVESPRDSCTCHLISWRIFSALSCKICDVHQVTKIKYADYIFSPLTDVEPHELRQSWSEMSFSRQSCRIHGCLTQHCAKFLPMSRSGVQGKRFSFRPMRIIAYCRVGLSSFKSNN